MHTVTCVGECFDLAYDRFFNSGKYITEGTMGVVFEFDPNTIVKLHPVSDYAYMCFIQWVQSLTDEPYAKYFPKVTFYEERSDYVIAVMERLHEYSSIPQQEHAEAVSNINNDQNMAIDHAMSHLSNRFIHLTDLRLNRDYIRPKYKAFSVVDGLDQAFKAILDNVFIPGFACDLHGANVMFRRDLNGQCEPVIIDPFTNGTYK